jgi:hypothetical protein
MRPIRSLAALSLATAAALAAAPAGAATFFFSTGDPDGRMAALSRPSAGGVLETETADDFVLATSTRLTSATFTGLVTGTAAPGVIGQVGVEIYRVFPQDSDTVRTPSVPTRVNSPSDVAITLADSGGGTLSFSAATLSGSFTAANSVINGVNPSPSQFTGGEGAMSGIEDEFTVNFTTPIMLGPGHYYFVPQVQVTGGDFLWLSAPRPIVPPGTPFPLGATDLQAWIRNENLAPDWLRIGTDITHQGPFNMAFSLTGTGVPEPDAWAMMLVGFLGMGGVLRAARRKAAAMS